MARSWAEFLGDAEGPYETEVERAAGSSAGCATRSRASRRALTEQIAAVAFDPADAASWERLEEALLTRRRRRRARPPSSSAGSRRGRSSADLDDGARRGDRGAASARRRRSTSRTDPSVILVVGVNGTGKTTTIGKLAQKLREHGREVTLGAADTFRAAAEEQLEIWAKRAGRALRRRRARRRPAAVAYDAVGAGGDVVIVDTAGRLHTQTNLMDELAKVRRVIAGRLEGAPHETLLVVDATTGQNGAPAGAALLGGGRRHRRRADEARRLGEGRRRGRDRLRARPAGEADRRGGGPRRPAPVRPARLRPRARLA